MAWYKKILIKNRKEIVGSAIFSIILSLTLLLWHFGLGKSFVWTKISPISVPDIFNRPFYSALVYILPGALLFNLGFYKFLYFIIVIKLRAWKLYKEIKKFIWIFLIVEMYAVISKAVDLLNGIISFAYNILGIILYILPPLGASLIIFIPLLIFVRKYNLKE